MMAYDQQLADALREIERLRADKSVMRLREAERDQVILQKCDEIERLQTARRDGMAMVDKAAAECIRLWAEIERLRAAAQDARFALDLALLAEGLNHDIKNRLRAAWLKVGDALRADRTTERCKDAHCYWPICTCDERADRTTEGGA